MAVERAGRAEGKAGEGLKKGLLFCLLLPLFCGCGDRLDIDQVPLRNLEGESVHIDWASNTCTVVYFLSPECPLCINYTRNLKQMAADFSGEQVQFIGVFSGEWIGADEVREYRTKYGLPFQMMMDSDISLAKLLNATVTPEAFLLDITGRVRYSGAIDNWMNALGRKKLEVTEHYLHNAITAALAGQKVAVSRTKAVGCLIE